VSPPPPVVELSAGDFARRGLDPLTDAPLADAAVDALRQSLARWLGIGSGGVIGFPFASLPPVPKPYSRRGAGGRRLPPGITCAGAGHPLWWLDGHSAWRDPDEGELAYGVRLILELHHRGLWIPGEGPVDVLATRLAWPPDGAERRARVASCAAGGWDRELSQLELEPGGPGRADLRRAAQEFLAPRLDLGEVLGARMAGARRSALVESLRLMEQLDRARPHLALRVERAAGEFRDQARKGGAQPATVELRRNLTRALEALVANVDRHAHTAPGGGGVAIPPLSGDPTGAEPTGSAARASRAAAILGAIDADPAAAEPFRVLNDEVTVWLRQCADRSEATRAGASAALAPRRRRASASLPPHPFGDLRALSPPPG